MPCLQARSTKLNSLNNLPILSLFSLRLPADLIRAMFYSLKSNTWQFLVLLRRARMRGHKYSVVIIVLHCANSPMIFQMFTQNKFVVGFRIGTNGQV